MKNFLVYKSSAGSGKTYTLVKEYLQIILENPDSVKNVLAITFTNAAAAEMKQRVIQALGYLSALAGKNPGSYPTKSAQLLEAISRDISMPPHTIIQNSALALSRILHQYADFNISTIDSFAHRIIRSFAFDLKIPVNFDIELDRNQLLEQAIDLMVSRAGSDEQLTKLLIDYIEAQTDEELSHHIENEIANLAQTLMDETSSPYLQKLKKITLDEFSEIHRSLHRFIHSFESKIQSISQKALQILNEKGVPTDVFYQKQKGIGAWFFSLANGEVEKKLTPNTYVRTTIESGKWVSKGIDKSIESELMEITPFLTDYFIQIQNAAGQEETLYRMARVVIKHLFPMAVMSELEKVIDEIKTDQSILHISDFNRRISEIVVEEPTPFIYERIGERYHHYMIDEFQDTSGLQWQNLLPLIDNTLASAYKNLVVGDGKQAIYRWRNGDVEQFASLPAIPDSVKAGAKPFWQNTLTNNYQPANLKTNFRSEKTIVEFNNTFFGFAKNNLSADLQSIYEDHEQEYRPDKTGGFVQIEFIEAEKNDDSLYRERTHQQILYTINRLQNEGHALSNIAILCRYNRDASKIAEYLTNHQIRIISSESLLLTQSQEVKFIVAAMHLIDADENETACLEFVQYLIKSGKINHSIHDAINHLQKLTNRPYTDSDNSNNRITTSALEEYLKLHGIRFSFRSGKSMNLYELGEMLIQQFFHSRKGDPFLLFFLDVLHEYNNRFVSSLPDFLEWWHKNSSKYSVATPEGANAVRIMTIHKSKGLQFKVAICPFSDEPFSKLGKKGEWTELPEETIFKPLDVAWLSITKQLEQTPWEYILQKEQDRTILDILNTNYVAFTRAEEQLYILSKHPTEGKFPERSFETMLYNYLLSVNLWQPNQLVYSFGDANTWQLTEPEHSESITAGYSLAIQSTAWQDKIAVKQSVGEDDKTQSTVRGIQIHQIMEKMKQPSDLELIINQMVSSGELTQPLADAFFISIQKIISHPLAQSWYSAIGIARNECGMYNSQGQFLRADRVIIDKERVTLIDYKTGYPHPSHSRQINGYAEVISQMGYRKVESYLAYIDTGEIVASTNTSSDQLV